MSVVEAKTNTYADIHPIELGVEFDSREKLNQAFLLLSEGGRVDMDICELPWSPCAATLDAMYKSESIEDFMRNSYAYCKEHEVTIREHIQRSEG